MSCSGTAGCQCGCCSGTSIQTPANIINLPGLSEVQYRVGTWASFKESMLARLSSSDYPALAGLKTRDDDDFTIAFLDASAIVLDILTFYQERWVNESYIRTVASAQPAPPQTQSAATPAQPSPPSQSATELSRLTGYTPAPAVAASVYVAFTLKTTPGQPPNPSATPITIPLSTQIQSVPPQGQKPQTFETSADIPAKPDWNALAVQTGYPWVPSSTAAMANSAYSMYLNGTTTKLQVGDSLLLLGAERIFQDPQAPGSTPSAQWDVVVLDEVAVDTARGLTKVSWHESLPHIDASSPPWTTPQATADVYAFRQKATLFGHNAPNANMFVNANATATASFPNLIDTTPSDDWSWKNYAIASSTAIYLDAVYPKIVYGTWFALVTPSASSPVPGAQLYGVLAASNISLSEFAMSGTVTQLEADFDDPEIATGSFPLNSTEVWAQSEQLSVPLQPLNYPMYGLSVDLAELRPDLVGAQVIALTGPSQKISLSQTTPPTTPIIFSPFDATIASIPVNPGDVLTIIGLSDTTGITGPLSAPSTNPYWGDTSTHVTLTVADSNGIQGTILAALGNLALAPSSSSGATVTEYALVAEVIEITGTTDPGSYPHTRLVLQAALANCYDRWLTTVNANVGMATNGQSVSEVLGNGNASTPNQTFTLKQSPLTYVQMPNQAGSQSTLQVLVNGVPWTEVPSLYQQGPTAQVYETLNQSDGTTDVLFGDGVEGSVLPTGQYNIQANYRVGSGSAGNVAAGTLTTLVDRPLGVSGVTNPGPATGGHDAESTTDIQSNVSQTASTVGRAASAADYQSFAGTFAGIAKAYAIWIPHGPARGIFLTVAGVGGVALPPGNSTLTSLVTSIQSSGNPLTPIFAVSFLETLFGITAYVAFDPTYNQSTVESAISAALYSTFSFAQRTFGQDVTADEVSTVIQAVPGVVAVNVVRIEVGLTSSSGDLASAPGGYSLAAYHTWLGGQVTLNRPIANVPLHAYAYVPSASTQGLPAAAEILVLDPNPSNLKLMVMP